MGIGSFLFGKAPSQEIKPTTTISPEQQKILELLQSFLGEQLPTAGEGLGELSGLEQTSLQGLEELALQLTSGQGTPTTDKAASTVQELLDFNPEAFNEFFRLNVEEPLLQDFQKTILPGISRQFSADSGFFSTERQSADQAAGKNVIDAIARGRSEGALGAQAIRLGAVDASRGLDQVGLESLLQTLLAGGTPRSAEAAELGQQNTVIQQLLATLGTPTLENIVFNKPGTTGILTEGLGKLLGAAAGPLGAAGGKALAGLI